MTDKTQQTNAQIERKELRDLNVPEQDAEGVKGGKVIVQEIHITKVRLAEEVTEG